MKDPPLQSTMDLKFLFFFVIVVNCLPSDYEDNDDDEYDEYVDPKTTSNVYVAPPAPFDFNVTPPAPVVFEDCPEYSELSEASRNALSDGGLECDVGLFFGNIWYRFVPPASSQMSEQPIPAKHCGKLKIFAKLYLFQIFAIAINYFSIKFFS